MWMKHFVSNIEQIAYNAGFLLKRKSSVCTNTSKIRLQRNRRDCSPIQAWLTIEDNISRDHAIG